MRDTVRNWIDGVNAVAVFGWLINVLPHIAIFFTAIWAVFRVLEMKITYAIVYRLTGWNMERWMRLPKRDDGQ